MATFKSYKEAVLANGSAKGIYTSMSGHFITQDALTGRLLSGVNEGWNPCNPADYLESLESFLASGKRLKHGDDVVGLHDTVVTMFDESVQEWNCGSYKNCKRYILQAAADQKEAFDAIDTTPQQYEALSSSDKPKSSECDGEEVAVLEEIIRLKEAECEKLFDDKLALLDEITWLHNKLIIEGRRYGASMKREFIAKMIKDMGGDHGGK